MAQKYQNGSNEWKHCMHISPWHSCDSQEYIVRAYHRGMQEGCSKKKIPNTTGKIQHHKILLTSICFETKQTCTATPGIVSKLYITKLKQRKDVSSMSPDPTGYKNDQPLTGIQLCEEVMNAGMQPCDACQMIGL